jgi:hypothetical protein
MSPEYRGIFQLMKKETQKNKLARDRTGHLRRTQSQILNSLLLQKFYLKHPQYDLSANIH